MALIDQGRREVVPGKIYAIRSGDVVQIKMLEPLADGRIKVISRNQAYPSYDVDPQDLYVIGRLIWSSRAWV